MSKLIAELGLTSSPPTVGAVFLHYQQQVIADKCELKVIEKSRRVGLSWAEGSDDVLDASAAKSAGGMNVYYIGYNQDMAIEYIEACAGWAKVFNYVAGEIEEGMWDDTDDDRHIKTYTIRFPASGHRIVALSSRPANLRGKQGKIVIDEAAFHDRLDELLKAAMAMLIWGGRVIVISTHNGESNTFNELIKEIRAGKRNGSVHKITFMDAVRDGLFWRVCLRLGKEWSQQAEDEWVEKVYGFYGEDASEELDVTPKSGSGAYFTRVIIEQCQDKSIPVVRYTLPSTAVTDPDRIDKARTWLKDTIKPLLDNLNMTRRTVYGQDFGRTGDLSSLRIMQDALAGQWSTAFDLDLRNIPFDVQWLITEYILDNIPHFHHACFDSRGNGQAHAEKALQKYGKHRVTCVMATQSWYAEHFPPYKAAHEDKSITVPADEDNITDHRRVILKKGIPGMDEGRDKGSDGMFRHGDRAIAGLMAWVATRTNGDPAAGETIDDPMLEAFIPESGRRKGRVALFNQKFKRLFNRG